MVYLLLVALVLGVVAPSQAVTHADLLLPAQQTMELIYNMEFGAALQAAQGLIDQAPTHPAGYFYRAATYWQWRTLARDPQQQAALLQDFAAVSQRAIEVAERLPATQATEAAFYLGGMHGVRARMYFVQKEYGQALQAAKQGGSYLQQCVAQDPTWYDAYVGLGTYHYVLSRVPGLWRGIVQQLIGVRGDREQGLRELVLARTQGPLSGPEATSILAKIYTLPDEQRYEEAAVLLEELVQRYPKNFDYRYRLAYLATLLGRWQHGQQLIQGLITAIEQGHPYYPRQWLPTLRYRVAETSVLQGNHQTAATILTTLQQQDVDTALHTWVLLRLGNVHDLRGEHQAAQALYSQVRDDTLARQLARRYHAHPFKPGRAKLKKPEETI